MYYLTLPSYYLGNLNIVLDCFDYILAHHVYMHAVQYSTGRQAGRQAGRQTGIRTSIRAGHIVLHVHTYTTSIENSATYISS